MQRPSSERDWRSLPPTEKQRRLASLRHRQHQQLVRDARALGLRDS